MVYEYMIAWDNKSFFYNHDRFPLRSMILRDISFSFDIRIIYSLILDHEKYMYIKKYIDLIKSINLIDKLIVRIVAIS